MATSGPFPAEDAPAGHPAGNGATGDREIFLGRVLDDEAGRLAPDEYARRVLAVNAAASEAQTGAVAHAAAGGEGDGLPDRPSFDAVDLARLGAQRRTEARRSRARYAALAVVAVMFLVLVVVGMWLATHVANGSAGAVGAARAVLSHAVD